MELRSPFGAGREDRNDGSEMATMAAVDHDALNERVKPEPLDAGTEAPESLVTVSRVRVLVVEDEVDLAEAVARGLRREGYAVDVAVDGDAAVEKLSYTEYDLVCLDLTLPKIDGREICRRIRNGDTASTGARVLMLTARDAVEDRVAGLDEGADDYLVKPYAFAELTARVRTLLRRDAGKSGALLEVGELRLDTARHEAWRGDRLLDLTAKEFALLRYFMSRAGEVLSTEDLLEHVWDEFTDPFTNTVRVTVGTLRRKLSADGESPLIETLIGSGYRLITS
jgi:DNA-binding response OmpR family regulator